MFSLVDAPSQFPGRELMGFNSPEGVVDTGVDFNGWVYLGRQTVHEAATLFGYTDPETAEKLRGVILSQGNELAALRAKLADLDPVLKALKNLAAEAPLAGVAL